MNLILNPEFNLYEKDGKPFCDSLQVADEFEKQHTHVLRDIENVLNTFSRIGESKFGFTNFIKSSYKSAQNKKLPMYLMSKDGFTYLTMGYEGEKAAAFKIAYIKRFNQMESFIQSLLTTKMEFPAFTEAIMLAHPEPKHYHFSNEINMIYRIVLNMDAKAYRKAHGIDDGAVIKPFLILEQIKAIETLQRVDIGLHEAGLSFEERKAVLNRKHEKMTEKLTG